VPTEESLDNAFDRVIAISIDGLNPPSHHEAWSVPHSRQDRPFTIDRNDSRLVAKLTAELRRSPRVFTFVHLALPDQLDMLMASLASNTLMLSSALIRWSAAS
jgi:hypothetical protein